MTRQIITTAYSPRARRPAHQLRAHAADPRACRSQARRHRRSGSGRGGRGWYHRSLAPLIIATGGINRHNGIVEGREFARQLTAAGVPASTVRIEDQPKDTWLATICLIDLHEDRAAVAHLRKAAQLQELKSRGLRVCLPV